MEHKHRRKQMRLQHYDYRQDGAYFITICTFEKTELFGNIVNGTMILNHFGNIVQNEWLKTAALRDYVSLDEYIVMPNHIHGIIYLRRGTARRAPTLEHFGKPVSGSIPTIVRSFKSAVTKHINEYRGTPTQYVWQRSFYDHIIRNDKDLMRVRNYITNNPTQWASDRNHPDNA